MGTSNSSLRNEQKVNSITPVDVDLNYFDRLWFEIGRYEGPFKFETGCVGATAFYSDLKDPKNPDKPITELKPGLSFKVTNKCVNKGSYDPIKETAVGTAEILDTGTILVSFPQIPKFVIDMMRKKRQGNYIVIDYESDLYSVVTSPKFDYLWILSTDKDFGSTEKYQELKQRYTTDSRFNQSSPGIKKQYKEFKASDYKNIE